MNRDELKAWINETYPEIAALNRYMALNTIWEYKDRPKDMKRLALAPGIPRKIIKAWLKRQGQK
ncbi:MAG: hypothetical protein LC723_07465 [Actinobacteria bacterium]|nr:hypothetical protein [Actinomycetota bacterium]